jgi:arsenate reductase-like glutaredoxin family protein
LRRALESVNAEPADVLSKRSKVYRERTAEIDAMDAEQLLAAMVAEPTLIRRPLVIADGTLVTGFDRTGLQALAEAQTGSE